MHVAFNASLIFNEPHEYVFLDGVWYPISGTALHCIAAHKLEDQTANMPAKDGLLFQMGQKRLKRDRIRSVKRR